MNSISKGVYVELQNLGFSALLGAAMAAFYDIIRILRRIKRHNILWVSIEDVMYWILFAVSEFILLYQKNNGEPRGYMFIGTIAGVFVYHCTVSRPLMKFMSGLINKIKKHLQNAIRCVKIMLSTSTH